MFLEKLKENNEKLIATAFDLHQRGLILPDTYLLDLDTIIENGRKMVEVAKPLKVDLYFMLKQIGRNPIIGKELMKVGFQGCVAVDYKEALTMIENDIPLCNVGHLVQIPKFAMDKIISSKPKYVTVYSKEIIEEINKSAQKANVVQKILVRITDKDAKLYSGQVAGFPSERLLEVVQYIESLKNVAFGGITLFPALLYDDKQKAIVPTDNIHGLNRAKEVLKENGYEDYMINLPSASCVSSIPLVHELGGMSCEPGHGLTGTTPLHVHFDEIEKVGYCYVSEVSHNYLEKAYCYGGGHYRRGHMENCLVGDSIHHYIQTKVCAPDMDSIDYHYELDQNFEVGQTCVMCYRSQIFTTRSNVAVIKGIQEGNPEIIGYYDSFGKKIEKNW